MIQDLIIIGGGAAGFFGALAYAEKHSGTRVVILEKTRQPLAKVRISGGGRCNTTHHCFEPAEMMGRYPRGSKFLRPLFHRFQPHDTIAWFAERGVVLKTEEDGRMFPITDSSQTIIDCFMRETNRLGIQIRLGIEVTHVRCSEGLFLIATANGEELVSRAVLIATGSNVKAHAWLHSLGHAIVPPVPSLFTFCIQDERIDGLAGVAVKDVQVQCGSFKEKGPLLITHWGLSGPAVLRLSAWGARELHAQEYATEIKINWIPSFKQEGARSYLLQAKERTPGARVAADSLFGLPKQLWERLLLFAGAGPEMRYSGLSNTVLNKIAETLTGSIMKTSGKSLHKEEFVTCGGVSLDEIHPQTMESKICPGLYFAGEVLDIDGITGGFNFQSAWTTSWIAAESAFLRNSSMQSSSAPA